MSEKLCPICGGKKIYSPSREEERGWLCNKCGSEFFDTDMNNTFWQRRITELEAENARLKSEIVSKDKKLTDYEKELRQLQSDWQDVPRVSVRRTYWMPFRAAPAVNKRYLVKLRNDWICIATYYLRVGGGYWKDDRGQELTDGVVEFWKGLDE